MDIYLTIVSALIATACVSLMIQTSTDRQRYGTRLPFAYAAIAALAVLILLGQLYDLASGG